MLRQIGWPLIALASWLGGWFRVLLLILAIAAVAGGLIWERQRHPPLPPQAQQVATSLMADIRQTSFQYPGTIAELRAFYEQALPQRGWRYCGTQATPNCTNLPGFGAQVEIDVYRRVADRNGTGVTIEVWPIWDAVRHETFVKVFETTFRDTPPPQNAW